MKAIGTGRLTADPELRTTPQGDSVVTFTLASNRRYKRDVTDFHKIVVWKKLAENCAKFLHKGSEAYIEGEIHNCSYEAKDGTKRYVTEVIADTVQFIGGSKQSDTGASDKPPLPAMTEINEDMPF